MQPPVAQVKESAQVDKAECGKLAAQAVAQAVIGRFVPLNIPDNAVATQLSAGLTAAGIPNTVSMAPLAALEASEYPKGHYLIVGVNCTPWAVPVPYVTGRRHWLAGYGLRQDYNCWNATYDHDDMVACHNPNMGTVIVPGPASHTFKEPEMVMIRSDPNQGGNGDIELILGEYKRQPISAGGMGALQAAGVGVAQLSPADFSAVLSKVDLAAPVAPAVGGNVLANGKLTGSITIGQ